MGIFLSKQDDVMLKNTRLLALAPRELVINQHPSVPIREDWLVQYNQRTRRKLIAGKAASKIKNVLRMQIVEGGNGYSATFENYLMALSDEKAKTIITDKNILKVILYSASEGLMLFHKNGFTHRIINPDNIVICKENEGYVAKISDLSLSTNPNNSNNLSDSTVRKFLPNICSAPEIINNIIKKRDSNKINENLEKYPEEQSADVFSMGVVFFYTLTRAYPYARTEDIVNDQDVDYMSIKEKSEFLKEEWDFLLAKQLIKSMLNRKPEDRPTMQQVMNHPFFWSLTKMKLFLMTASQYIQGEDRIDKNEVQIQSNSQIQGNAKKKTQEKKTNEEQKKLNKELNPIVKDWIRNVDPILLIYNNKNDYTDTASELSRFLRNFPTHYPERKNENLRKNIAKEGALLYCLKKLPNFFVHFYSYFNEAPYSEYDTLREFYCDCYLSNMFADHYCKDVDDPAKDPKDNSMDNTVEGTKDKKFVSYRWVKENTKEDV